MERNTISNLIKSPVGTGKGALNDQKDVKIIKYLFNLVYAAQSSLTTESGTCDTSLVSKIKRFQKEQLGFRICDGRIDPGGKTLSKLVEKAKFKYSTLPKQNVNAAPHLFGGAWCGNDVSGAVSDIHHFLGFRSQPRNDEKTNQAHRVLVNNFLAFYTDEQSIKTRSAKRAVTEKVGSAGKLTDEDFKQAAIKLGNGIPVELIKAFAIVESGGRSGFGPEGLPVIAFEGHLFRDYTRQKYDATHPNLSYPYVEKAGKEWKINNKDQVTAWKTLTMAMELDVDAALMCCSWGMFQVLGANHWMTGHRTVQKFVEEVKSGEVGQLNIFVEYCKKKSGMMAALKSKDFRNMAFLYNGKHYGDYDVKIANAYKKLLKDN